MKRKVIVNILGIMCCLIISGCAKNNEKIGEEVSEKEVVIEQEEEVVEEETSPPEPEVQRVTEVIAESGERRFCLTFDEFLELYNKKLIMTSENEEFESITREEFEKSEYSEDVDVYYTDKYEDNASIQIYKMYDEEKYADIPENVMYLKVYVNRDTDKIEEIEFAIYAGWLDGDYEDRSILQSGIVFSCFHSQYYNACMGAINEAGDSTWDSENHVVLYEEYDDEARVIFRLKPISDSDEAYMESSLNEYEEDLQEMWNDVLY